MPWIYHQRTGQISRNGDLEGSGYSGTGSGRNNPDDEAVANVGPIPRGQWTIGKAYNDEGGKGPIVMQLEPVGHNAHGRTLFRIHGNNEEDDASEGCVILPKDIRRAISGSGDYRLEVVE